MKAPRCGAKNRQGKPCQAPAMRGKARCRLHGGKSTGARTLTGIQRIRKEHWKNGGRSKKLQKEYRQWARIQEQAETMAISALLTQNREPW